MQDVDAYLVRRGIEIACFFDPLRRAVLDDRHQVRLNYEAFFFSETTMVEEFRADPVRFCGLLTDPVSKRRFRPKSSSPRIEFEGVAYYFETRETHERFRRRPHAHAVPGYRM